MGGDTAHSTTPRSTHSHKTRLSFLRRTPIRTRHILHTRSTKYSYLLDATWNNHSGTNTLRPGTHISYHNYGPASPCEYNLPIPCHPPVPILVRLKSGPKHLNVHMHHNTTEGYTNSTCLHRLAIGTPKQPRRFSRCQSYKPHLRGRTRLLVPHLPKQVIHDNAYMNTGAKLHHNARPHGSLCKQG
jgi:hypothetical protein